MRKVFQAFGTTLVTNLDTITQGSLILNHLARGGVHRAYVVENKSEQSAAVSELRGQTQLAIELHEAQKEREGITDDTFAASAAFMEHFRKRRQERENKTTVEPIKLPKASIGNLQFGK